MVVLLPWEQVRIGSYYGAEVLLHVISTAISREILGHYVKAVIMYRSLHHPNILMFQGAGWSTRGEIPMMYVTMIMLTCIIVCCSLMATEKTNAGYLHTLIAGSPYANPSQAPAPMPYATVVDIARDVAAAMSYLHGQCPQVLHRNLRASSIHLTHDETRVSGYSAKVASFEWSRRLANDFMTAMQGPAHVAPEMMHGGDYTTAVDVYSFGIRRCI
ncbi:hypothetical protein ACHHYP_02226 [Achlya hypogyna]|uniref:Protein kinase domain-containing protein n=1 Tax=Achlya hypogyna TaxID=1202772 RepID=A0A1V9ZS70_ACHHY|nr:hypothetical protein ACHHYP_02226 [Achlya hypogyna]